MSAAHPVRSLRWSQLLILSSALLLCGCLDSSAQHSYAVAEKGLYAADLSRTAGALLVATINQGGSLWDTAGVSQLFDLNYRDDEPSTFVAVALAGDGSYAITVDPIPVMMLWNARTGQAMRSWILPHEVSSVALADAARRLLIGTTNNEALVFDLRRGGIEHRLPHDDEINDVAISIDGRFGLTVADDDLARLWDLSAAKELRRWELGNNGMTAALSSSGRYAFAAAQSARAAVWDTGTGELVFELNPYYKWIGRGISYSSARFSPEEDELLTGSVTGQVKRWSLDATPGPGKILSRWTLGRRSWISPSAVKLIALAYASNGAYFAVGSNGLAYVLAQQASQ
ncbi:WD40 repeat domain-containing protein [Rhabdochromatium marinum]|uniref:WD40 repeat domain-containing protein n=1 Tax=Rhabdochromatium marinum TaxID=48729 RepID=UPI0019057A49|nr:WD40 repeat domain-containing protein [Rhabdochromatium marinum]MBK1648881.1 hypothetical protein [Rhabdochromatium marinum]